MISQDSIKQISHLFCGDIEGYYSYKSGPQLVAFFNQYFNASDKYGAGFPSRWSYVFDKIVAMFSNNTIDSFITTILDKQCVSRTIVAGAESISFTRKKKLDSSSFFQNGA